MKGHHSCKFHMGEVLKFMCYILIIDILSRWKRLTLKHSKLVVKGYKGWGHGSEE